MNLFLFLNWFSTFNWYTLCPIVIIICSKSRQFKTFKIVGRPCIIIYLGYDNNQFVSKWFWTLLNIDSLFFKSLRFSNFGVIWNCLAFITVSIKMTIMKMTWLVLVYFTNTSVLIVDLPKFGYLFVCKLYE